MCLLTVLHLNIFIPGLVSHLMVSPFCRLVKELIAVFTRLVILSMIKLLL